MASGEGNAPSMHAIGDSGETKQASGPDSLEGLMSSLSQSIRTSDWLQKHTAEKWAEENPEAYAKWMAAIQPPQSSASQTASTPSESTACQTPTVDSQHSGSQTPSTTSQTTACQTFVAAQDAAVP